MSLSPALPVLLTDLPAVHRLSFLANSEYPPTQLLFPNRDSEISLNHFVQQDEIRMGDLKGSGRHVCVKDGDQVVSYAAWTFLVGKGDPNESIGEGKEDKRAGGESGARSQAEDHGADADNWPADANREALKALIRNGKVKREDVMRERGISDYAFLASICTAPSHRRLGAASKLVEWGLALADTHLLPIYVEATPDGLPVYLKHGFEKVDTLEIDLRPWGRSEVLKHTILIRPAKKPAFNINKVTISPWLTNQDFTDFAAVEDRAFSESKPRVEGEADPPVEFTIPLPSFNQKDQKPEDITSIFTLINKNVTVDPHLSRANSLIHHASTDPTARFLKAFIPATGKVIGCAQWNFMLNEDTTKRAQPMLWAPNSNTALIDAFLGEMKRRAEAHMRGKKYIFMHVLVVLPEYQAKGIGTKLLQWGLRIADDEKVECWIDASAMGKGLYKKLGWKEVGELSMDLGEWGGRKGFFETAVHLVRPPQ